MKTKYRKKRNIKKKDKKSSKIYTSEDIFKLLDINIPKKEQIQEIENQKEIQTINKKVKLQILENSKLSQDNRNLTKNSNKTDGKYLSLNFEDNILKNKIKDQNPDSLKNSTLFEITNSLSGNPNPYNENDNDIIKDQIINPENRKKENTIINKNDSQNYSFETKNT